MLKGSMSGDVRDFNNIETRAVIKFFFLQGKSPKEIHAILIEILGENVPSYATIKNWVAQFKREVVAKTKESTGRPKKNWMEGIKKAMNGRNLKEGQWEYREQCSLGVGQRRKTVQDRQ
jgi:transposase